MRNSKGQFTQGNSGKPKGAKGKLNKDKLYLLLNEVVEDFANNYDKLSTNHKLRLLVHFASLFKEEEIQMGIEPRVFNIINDNEQLKEVFNL